MLREDIERLSTAVDQASRNVTKARAAAEAERKRQNARKARELWAGLATLGAEMDALLQSRASDQKNRRSAHRLKSRPLDALYLALMGSKFTYETASTPRWRTFIAKFVPFRWRCGIRSMRFSAFGLNGASAGRRFRTHALRSPR